MNKKHEAHEDHEAVWAYGAKYLFCKANLPTKQIFEGAFWRFCLMLAHNPHDFLFSMACSGSAGSKITKNMRIMRIYEEGLFNGFYLPCIYMGSQAPQKHEAVMRQHEDCLMFWGDMPQPIFTSATLADWRMS